MKYCTKTGVNLFSLTCKLLQGSKILSDCKNNIVVQSTSGDIVLHYYIKTCDGWLARNEFLQEISPERAQLTKSLAPKQQKDINILHADLGHPLEVITKATGRAMRLNHASLFKSFEDCALGKSKKSGVSQKAVEHSKILCKTLFFNIF